MVKLASSWQRQLQSWTPGARGALVAQVARSDSNAELGPLGARTAALESLRGAYQRCRPRRILSIRRRRSGRFFSRPMPRAHTGPHRSVAVIAPPCPATLRIRGDDTMYSDCNPVYEANLLCRCDRLPAPGRAPAPARSPYQATICSSATKVLGHPSTCTSGSCSSLLRVAFWWRHSLPRWPPRTDPLGAGLLSALKRRA